MNKHIESNIIKSLSREILNELKGKECLLKEINKDITGDSDVDINNDYSTSLNFLDHLQTNYDIPPNLKPKGRILMILSYNEPMILSVIPVISALIAGNKVYLRPSSKNINFVRMIWSDKLIKKFNSNLEILAIDKSELPKIIKSMDCVCFFGSHNVAREIYKLYAENFIEFLPEIETADCKVVKLLKTTQEVINQDCENTLHDAFSHYGQTCQRISGLFLHTGIYKMYVETLLNTFLNKQYSYNSLFTTNVEIDIQKSCAENVYQNNNSGYRIVIKPREDSDFYKNGYFATTLWIQEFKTEDCLIDSLNHRKYYLGLNIIADDDEFINKIVKNTKYTRYTVNTRHTSVMHDNGWGGRWPSGSGGYKDWVEHFSNRYQIIHSQ